MRPVIRSTRLRVLVLVAAACAVVGYLAWDRAPADPRAEVVAGAAREGWQTIEYRGVRVDLPAAWSRREMRDCEFRYERWAAPGSADCANDGVAFYGAALFDPSRGPGISRSDDDGRPGWSGYVYAGDFAVYANDPDRAVVSQVLGSAREVR